MEQHQEPDIEDYADGKKEEVKNQQQYRSFNLYIILTSSILIIIAGIYVIISPKISKQFDWVYDDPLHIGVVNGSFLIIFGVILAIFPVFFLLKKRFQK